jgi:hypothetical protein
VRRAFAAAAVALVAASLAGAATGGGIGLSASPLRVTLRGSGVAAVTVRNPGRRSLLVDVSRAGFARSLRGRPRIRPARRTSAWLRFRPRRLRVAPGGKAVVHVRAAPPRRAEPGDHPALLLLTTRPLGKRRVRVRLRVGVVVDLRVPGRIVRRLDARALTVRRLGESRVLGLLLVNRGNVTERLGEDGLRLVLGRHGRRFATLRPQREELLPRSRGVAEFAYRGPVRGEVDARIELRPSIRGRRAVFHLRL